MAIVPSSSHASGSGSGDVVGPGSSVVGQFATYADTTGKLIAASARPVPVTTLAPAAALLPIYPISALNANIGANVAMGVPFTVPYVTTVNRIGFHVSVSSGNIDAGIYLRDGTAGAPLTRVVSLGSTACPAAAGPVDVTIATTVLTPGDYWALVACDNGVAQFGYTSQLYGSPSLNTRVDVTASFPLPATIAGVATQAPGTLWTIYPYGV